MKKSLGKTPLQNAGSLRRSYESLKIRLAKRSRFPVQGIFTFAWYMLSGVRKLTTLYRSWYLRLPSGGCRMSAPMVSTPRPYRPRPKSIVSAYMSRIRGKGTRIEQTLGSEMWRAGLRYRKQPKFPGKPDFAFLGPRVAVFLRQLLLARLSMVGRGKRLKLWDHMDPKLRVT